MFQTDKHESTISHVNLRKQRHGRKARRLGIDISFVLNSSNEILDGLEKGLKESFFRKATKNEQIDAFPSTKNDLVAVKHPGLDAISIEGSFPGYELQLDGLMEGEASEPLFLSEVELKDFSFKPQEGGGVSLYFKAGVTVEAEELAAVGDFYTRERARLTCTPPAKQEGGEQTE